MFGRLPVRKISNTMGAALLAASGSMGLATLPAHADGGTTTVSTTCAAAVQAFLNGLTAFAAGHISLATLTRLYNTMAADCGLPTLTGIPTGG